MQQLKNFKALVEQLNSTNSTLKKSEILKNNNNEDNKILFDYVYNTFKMYGVTSKSCKKLEKKFLSNSILDYSMYSFFELKDSLNRLISRDLSGYRAISEVLSWTKSFPEYEDIIFKIINKDLKARTSIKLINKEFNNFIPTFDVALADKYDEKTKKLVDETYTIMRKSDGTRIITIFNNNKTEAFTRSGKPYTVLGKFHEENILDQVGLEGYVIDGEFVGDSEEDDFKTAQKAASKKGVDATGVKLCVFDILTVEEFESKISTVSFVERSKRFEKIKQFLGPKIEHLEVVLYNEENFEIMQNKAIENDWEGLILRKDSPYQGKRSKDILKFKEFSDAEYEVVDTVIGEMNFIVDGKNTELGNMLKRVNIIHEGNIVGVGSGWSKDERIHYGQFPEDIKGKIITVKYKKESEDSNGKKSLQFPVVKVVHGAVREF